MFGLDDRYITIVAYVEGCNAATGWRLLKGLGEWLVSQRGDGQKSSVAWFGLLVYYYNPALRGRMKYLTPEESAPLIVKLFDVLDEFFADHPATFTVLPLAGGS